MIIRDILWHPADPHHYARGLRRPWDTARALNLHGTTVKRRIADMRESGLLRAILLQPAPPLVGRRGSEYTFTYANASAKRRGFHYLSEDPTVWAAYGLVGNTVIADFVTPDGDDPQKNVDRLVRESGAVSAKFHHLNDWDVPVDKISALDLRIMAAFAGDAFRPISEAAAEVGVTAKTVTTRMRALARMRAFRVYTMLDYSKMSGGMTVFLNLNLELGSTETVHVELPNRFPQALCRSMRGAENGYVVVQAEGPKEVEEIIHRAQSIPGVDSVDLGIVHDAHAEPSRWQDALLARAEELARANGVWSASWRAKPKPVETDAPVPRA